MRIFKTFIFTTLTFLLLTGYSENPTTTDTTDEVFNEAIDSYYDENVEEAAEETLRWANKKEIDAVAQQLEQKEERTPEEQALLDVAQDEQILNKILSISAIIMITSFIIFAFGVMFDDGLRDIYATIVFGGLIIGMIALIGGFIYKAI